MERHVNPKHTSSPKRREFKCEVCSKVFTSKKSVNGHMMSHKRGKDSQSGPVSAIREDRNQEKFKCEECGKLFSSKISLVRHATCHNRTEVSIHPYIPQETFERDAVFPFSPFS